MKLIWKTGGLLVVLACTLWVVGCTTSSSSHDHGPIRVGITADYPPMVFKNSAGFQGAEIDMANALGKAIGRQIQFVDLRWDDQIEALLQGRTDIIMSAMSVTKARQLRILFSDSYLKNDLRVIFRRKDANYFKTPEDFLKTDLTVGVVVGTTADAFVQKYCPNARRMPLETRQDAAFYLIKNRRIDAYVDDSFALAQILSENEADIAYLQQPLNEEDLAWGVRPTDQAFLDAVNQVLAQWKADGTLDSILQRWMPYLKNLK